MENKTNNRELNIVLDILDYSTHVEKIYNYLAKLEIEGKKDTEEYEDIASLIEDAIKIENQKYRQIPKFLSKDIIEIKKLIEGLNRTTDESILNVTEMNSKTNKLKRLYAHIRDYSLIRNEEEDVENNEEEMISVEFLGFVTQIPKKLAEQYGIDKQLEEKDKEIREKEAERRKVTCDLIYYKFALINSLFIDYLEEYISNCNNKLIKNRLIKYKYQLIFSTPSLEAGFAKHPKHPSNTEYLKEIVAIKIQEHPAKYHDDFLKNVYYDVSDSVVNLSQADYHAKQSSLDEKVAKIIEVLYTKACLSTIYDEGILESLQTTKEASLIDYASKDDYTNVNEVFNTDEKLRMPILKRKNVD